MSDIFVGDFRKALLEQKLIPALVQLIKKGNIIIVHSIAHILVALGAHGTSAFFPSSKLALIIFR